MTQFNDNINKSHSLSCRQQISHKIQEDYDQGSCRNVVLKDHKWGLRLSVNNGDDCRIEQRITECIINVLHSMTATLSMSFQHFSTIFLSTTAGCWGWGGCWWGWNASFISPIRPAPLRGYPAISAGLGDGIRGGVTGVNRGLLRTRDPSKTCTLPVWNSGVGFTCKYGRSVTKKKKTPLWTRRERR